MRWDVGIGVGSSHDRGGIEVVVVYIVFMMEAVMWVIFMMEEGLRCGVENCISILKVLFWGSGNNYVNLGK